MSNFLTKSGPGILAIVLVAGVGYFVLTPPSMPATQAAAIDSSAHMSECLVCRLPLYGQLGESSLHGIDRAAHAWNESQ